MSTSQDNQKKRLPKDTFQIGWICALSIELAAARVVLDEEFEDLEYDPSDTNVYKLGRVGKHNVVIACLPKGRYGTNAAAQVASNMTRSFSASLRVGVLVGIGGGIPTYENDVRLGDVVISTPGDQCGGVVQYDLGKEETDGHFRRKGSLNNPPTSLLTATTNMEADQELGEISLLPFIEQGLRRFAASKRHKWERPGLANDQLYSMHHNHLAELGECVNCQEMVVNRKERSGIEPLIHYGIIASGNRVIKNAKFRDQIGKDLGAICFEMEAAGLMQDFPYIVIRGICDYSDSHKNDGWQCYAALVAAACAKELLSHISIGQMSEEVTYAPLLQDIRDNQEKAYQQRERHQKERISFKLSEEEQNCLQVFKTSSYDNFKNLNRLRELGTCQWVMNHPRFLHWLSRGGILLISADPGCGKSVLAKSLVDQDLEDAISEPATICHFFFKDNDDQKLVNVALCAILHQLFSDQPHLIHHAVPSWKKNKEKLAKETDLLGKILEAASLDIEARSMVFVLDALDECQERDQERLVKLLNRITGHNSTDQKIRVMVTSRPYDHIYQQLEAHVGLSEIQIRGEDANDQINEEINIVIRAKVENLCAVWNLSSSTRTRLMDQLLDMKQRTYLWFHLAFADMKVTLENSLWPNREEFDTPKTVYEAYEKILGRVPEKYLSRVLTILKIVVAARRPLSVEEMASALGIATDQEALSLEAATLDPRTLERTLRSASKLFIFVKTEKIYLIHQTAKTYLLTRGLFPEDPSPWHFSSDDAAAIMAFICIKALLLSKAEHWEEGSRFEKHILSYAASYWPQHYRMEPILPGIDKSIIFHRLRNPKDDMCKFWMYRTDWDTTVVLEHYERDKFDPQIVRLMLNRLDEVYGKERACDVVEEMLEDLEDEYKDRLEETIPKEFEDEDAKYSFQVT
ncbi:hypothetical protein ANO11243_004150 [Dothideomycetidae sp. 11243]|nr:hypothetical protein ANO11243_004150 [fungal sp. No.11243]